MKRWCSCTKARRKELYVLNPGGDQRTALKGFTRPKEEPAEVSELGREGVFMRPLGSLQSSIDWYYSLFKWGDTCTDAAVRRTAWYPSSYVGLLESGRSLALRVIALPPEADLTWLNGTRLADGCKPFNLVAKEMLEIGHTGLSEGLKAALYHNVCVKEAYWLATDEQYRRTDPTLEKKSCCAEVVEGGQPQPSVSKGDEGGKAKVLDGHGSGPRGLPTDAQDKPARRRIWQEAEKQGGRQDSRQFWESQEQSQLRSPPSSLSEPIGTEGSVEGRGKWYCPTHLDKRSFQPVFFQPYLFGAFHEALWFCYEQVVLACLFTRKTRGRSPYTRIFDRLMEAARSNQRGQGTALARLNSVVRQLACGMIVCAGETLRENPDGQSVVPHNGVLAMLTLYVIWWHENKHHPPPLGDKFDFHGLAQAVTRRAPPPKPPETPAPWPQPPWRSGNVERMHPDSEVWDEGRRGMTYEGKRRFANAPKAKKTQFHKRAPPAAQRPCASRDFGPPSGTSITQVQMNVGHSSQSVTLPPDGARHGSREHEAGNKGRRQERGAGSGTAFGPRASRHVPVEETMHGAAQAKQFNWSGEDIQAASGKGGDGIPMELTEWDEVLALLVDDVGAREETEGLTSELMDVGYVLHARRSSSCRR